MYVVSPGYFDAIGMRLIKGRDFRWDDNDKKVSGVIINETVARRLWPGQDPIDRIAEAAGMDARVIGVVADVHESSVEGSPGWQMYTSGVSPNLSPDGAQLVVRTKLPPATLAADVMKTLREINPAQPATEFRPVQNLVDHAVSPRRFFVLLVSRVCCAGVDSGFAGNLWRHLLFGDAADAGDRYSHGAGCEPGSGATGGDLENDAPGADGDRNRNGCVFLTAHLIASLLFGTPATDRATFLSMILLLLMVALLAGYIPARRASRINPMIALRNS